MLAAEAQLLLRAGHALGLDAADLVGLEHHRLVAIGVWVHQPRTDGSEGDFEHAVARLKIGRAGDDRHRLVAAVLDRRQQQPVGVWMAFGTDDLADEDLVPLPAQPVTFIHRLDRQMIPLRRVEPHPADVLHLQPGQRQPFGQLDRVEVGYFYEIV